MNKKTKHIIGSILLVLLFACVSTAALLILNQSDSEQARTSSEIVQLRKEADSERDEGIALLEKGQRNEALSRFKTALEKYQQADQRVFGDQASATPSPEIADMKAQIVLIETTAPPTPLPQQSPEDYPMIDTSAPAENPQMDTAPLSEGVIRQQ